MALVNNKFLKTTVAAIALQVCCGNALASNIETNIARMQAMDKITGRVSEIDVPVNGEAKFGSFSIVVRRCVTRSPEETPENTAFVDVVDNYNTDDPINIFKGWMFSSTPALNAVEHPIYDVWLLKCYNADLKGKKLLSEDELILRDEIPMQEWQKETSPLGISVGGSDEEENKEITGNATAASEENTTKSEENTIPAETSEVSQSAEVIAVVVSDDNISSDGGAPKALLQVQTQPQANAAVESSLPAENVSAPEVVNFQDNTALTEAVDTNIEDENAYISTEDEENGFINEDEENAFINEDDENLQ